MNDALMPLILEGILLDAAPLFTLFDAAPFCAGAQGLMTWTTRRTVPTPEWQSARVT